MQNDDYEKYADLVVKSYVVRIESADKVTISAGEILNKVIYDNNDEYQSGGGGGLYVGGDSGTQVMLGEVTITTTGENVGTDFIQFPDRDSSWSYKKNKTGGHAVEVVGGTLNIYGGTYTSAQGEGLRVSNGTVNVFGGTFVGRDSYQNQNGSPAPAGIAASYSLKLLGGEINVYGGRFGSGSTGIRSGGVCVMGNSADNKATAHIYGGTVDVKGNAGVFVYANSDVYFGEAVPSDVELPENLEISGPTIKGMATAISIPPVTGSSGDSNRTITIYGGDFSNGEGHTGNSDAIWYAEATTILKIYGGTFAGANRAGLYFEAVPGTHTEEGTTICNVQLHGGMFVGNSNNAVAINSNSPGEISTSALIADGYGYYTASGVHITFRGTNFPLNGRTNVSANGGNGNAQFNQIKQIVVKSTGASGSQA